MKEKRRTALRMLAIKIAEAVSDFWDDIHDLDEQERATSRENNVRSLPPRTMGEVTDTARAKARKALSDKNLGVL